MKRLFLLCLLLFLCGCATRPVITQENDLPGTEWNIASTVVELAGDDPIEPYNRSMVATTDFLMHWLARPVSWVYGSILPREVIKRIDFASQNLEFPTRMLSCFLQAKWKGGCTEIGRFCVNSTVGIAGLFDPAEYYLGWNQRQENMGHAFAKWGIGEGCLFFFPLCSSTNPRDFVGFIFDSFLDIKMFIPYACSISALNRAVNTYDVYQNTVENVQDIYETTKMGLVGLRFVVVGEHQYKIKMPGLYPVVPRPSFSPQAPVSSIRKQFSPQHPLVDTFRAVMFKMQHDHESWWVKNSLWNTDFSMQGKIRGVRENKDAPKRDFQFWLHSEKDKGRRNSLVLVIPGIGNSYAGNQPRALAELLYYNGYDVAVTSSTMNWLFAVTKESAFPGFIPDDVHRLRKHLQDILHYLKTEQGIAPKKIMVAGLSLGGLQAIHLAELESKQNTLGAVRYVAVNPPVDLMESIRRFDEFSAVTRKWTRREYFEQLGDALVKYFPAARKLYPYQPDEIERKFALHGEKETFSPVQNDYHIYISADQAAAMLGLNIRFVLRELIASAYRNGFVEGKTLSWSTRVPHYLEHDKRTIMDYVERYVIPQHPGKKTEDLSYDCGLKKLSSFLQKTDSVRVLHNLDDPLVSDENKAFLDRVLGRKMRWFDAGGHLGNLYMVVWQKEFLKLIEP